LIHERKGEIEKALELYELLTLKNTKFHMVYLHLGIIYLTNKSKKDIHKAQRYLTEALKFEETPDVL
jgi:hypothetical protein